MAWAPLGWQCVGVSEIDRFPSAVLAHRFPGVPNFGDFTGIGPDDIDGPVDLLVGGTPCQSFSVAGARAGLDDPRGHLTLEFLALARRLRTRWLVWENVPGILSHDGGRTFGTFLRHLGELGGGYAWRSLDAQYFGLAQRRKRVFVVWCAGGWAPAAAVLLEPEGLRGDPAPRREAGERAASSLAARTKGGGGIGTDAELDGALIAHSLRAEGFDASEDGTGRAVPLVPTWPAEVAPTLNAHFGDKQGLEDQHALNGGGLFVPHPTGGVFDEGLIAFNGQQDPVHGAIPGALDRDPLTQCIAFSAKDSGGDAETGLSPTLRAGGHAGSHANAGVMPAVAYDFRGREGGSLPEGPHDTANLRAASGGSSRSYVASTTVRRLTPRECERLQGFPDNWTQIPWRGRAAEDCPDGPRYKACGNSMAVPVMRWIGERLAFVDGVI